MRFSYLLPLIASCIAPAQSGDIQQQLRVQSALVSVPVIVTDSRGRFVPDLRAPDFAIYDDGIHQKTSLFASSQDPIHVALLLDTSRSTVTVIGKIKKAAADFVSHLRPQDLAMAVAFDAEVKVLSRMRADRRLLSEAVRGAEIGRLPGTRLHDAVLEALQKHLDSRQERRCLLLMSDGQDSGSRISVADLTSAAAESGAVIYPVHYRVDPRELMRKLFGISSRALYEREGSEARSGGPNQTWWDQERQAEAFLGNLAEQSGGVMYSGNVDDRRRRSRGLPKSCTLSTCWAFIPTRPSWMGNSTSSP